MFPLTFSDVPPAVTSSTGGALLVFVGDPLQCSMMSATAHVYDEAGNTCGVGEVGHSCVASWPNSDCAQFVTHVSISNRPLARRSYA